MSSTFICECSLEIAHCSYIYHIKSKRHLNLMKLQDTLTELKTDFNELKEKNEELKKQRDLLQIELNEVIKNLVNKTKN